MLRIKACLVRSELEVGDALEKRGAQTVKGSEGEGKGEAEGEVWDVTSTRTSSMKRFERDVPDFFTTYS